MSQWKPYRDDNTYYVLVDSKPDEVIDPKKPDTIFCTAFVNTASCFLGVKNPDLPWFKQYKECETLIESMIVLERLKAEIVGGNFHDFFVWVWSAKFSTIDRNGMNFLEGACNEVADFRIEGDYLHYKRRRYHLNKAKMLIWYNFCLCNMATYLVDKTLQWEQSRGVFHVDRLGDSDKRIYEFMRVLMEDTSLRKLWHRCAEDHDHKPSHVGYEFASQLDSDGRVIPAHNSMQSSLVDWMALAGYAARNGTENRAPEFQESLIDLIKQLDENKMLNGFHFNSEITWESQIDVAEEKRI